MKFRRNFVRALAATTVTATTSMLLVGALGTTAQASTSLGLSPRLTEQINKIHFSDNKESNNSTVHASALGFTGTEGSGDGDTTNSDIVGYSLTSSASNYVLGVSFASANASFNTNWSTGGGILWAIDGDGNGSVDYFATRAYSDTTNTVLTQFFNADTGSTYTCAGAAFAVSGVNMTLTFSQTCMLGLNSRMNVGVISIYNTDPSQGVDNAWISDYAPDDISLDSDGYWIIRADGYAEANGSATQFSGMNGMHLNKPIISAAASTDKETLWMLGGDGGVFTFCNPSFYTNGCNGRFFGSTGNIRLNKPAVSLETSKSGNGYWFVASDGGIFSYGDSKYYGSMGASHLNKPVVGMQRTPSGNGYWLVASDGGIFSFGDAKFYGSTGALKLNQPIIGMQRTKTGNGYWLFAADGGIFSFGDAAFYGSAADDAWGTIVGVTASRTGNGYTMLDDYGYVYPYGDGAYYNDLQDYSDSAAAIVGA